MYVQIIDSDCEQGNHEWVEVLQTAINVQETATKEFCKWHQCKKCGAIKQDEPISVSEN